MTSSKNPIRIGYTHGQEMSLNVLRAILSERLPIQTRLLPNYPNSVNLKLGLPSNWLKDTVVTITIQKFSSNRQRACPVAKCKPNIPCEVRRLATALTNRDVSIFGETSCFPAIPVHIQPLLAFLKAKLLHEGASFCHSERKGPPA